jgi:hypothetical protein
MLLSLFLPLLIHFLGRLPVCAWGKSLPHALDEFRAVLCGDIGRNAPDHQAGRP